MSRMATRSGVTSARRRMASKNRERKAIKSCACPDCGAPRGELCRREKKHNVSGRLFVCRGRLILWQMVRDGEVK